MNSKSLFTLSNAISAMRVVLAVPAYQAILGGDTERAVIIMIVAAITDGLDGFIARSTGTVSEAGKIIDPVADKIFVGACVIALLLRGILPLWYVLIILGRDVLLLIGSLVVRRKSGSVLPSNYAGKIAVSSIGIVLLVSLYTNGALLGWLMGLSIALMVWSLVNYTLRSFSRRPLPPNRV